MRHLFWGGVHPAGRKELSRGAAPTPPPPPSLFPESRYAQSSPQNRRDP